MTTVYLPLTPAAECALKKALLFIHPSHSGMDQEEYISGCNLLIEQAALAILKHRATHHYVLNKPRLKRRRTKGNMVGHSLAENCWPPSFDVRVETEDEAFARMVLATY